MHLHEGASPIWFVRIPKNGDSAAVPNIMNVAVKSALNDGLLISRGTCEYRGEVLDDLFVVRAVGARGAYKFPGRLCAARAGVVDLHAMAVANPGRQVVQVLRPLTKPLTGCRVQSYRFVDFLDRPVPYSRSLFPSLMTYLHTGVRAAESRIQWKQLDFEKRTITVGRSKTKGREGRVIPLNDEAFEILVEWHSRFKDAKPDHYVFPSERVRKSTAQDNRRVAGPASPA